jgi:hypothetical protein
MTGFHLPPIIARQCVTGHSVCGSGTYSLILVTISKNND